MTVEHNEVRSCAFELIQQNKLRIHRNEINRAITMSLHQQKHYFDFLTTAFTLQKQQQSLTFQLTAVVMNSTTTAHTKAKKDFKP
jgi:hypothetical protein